MTNDEIEGQTETREEREGTALILTVGGAMPGPDDVRDCIDTGLSGMVIEGMGFVVPFGDWTAAEECLRIIREDVKRAAEAS